MNKENKLLLFAGAVVALGAFLALRRKSAPMMGISGIKKSDLRKTKVSNGEGQNFDALVKKNETWNGYAIPYFDRATAIEVLREIDSLLQMPDSAGMVGDVATITYEGETDQFKPVTIEGKKYWPIGAYKYTWEEGEAFAGLGA